MKFNLGNLLAIIGSGSLVAIVLSIIFGRDSRVLYAGYFIGACAYVIIIYLVSHMRKHNDEDQ